MTAREPPTGNAAALRDLPHRANGDLYVLVQIRSNCLVHSHHLKDGLDLDRQLEILAGVASEYFHTDLISRRAVVDDV